MDGSCLDEGNLFLEIKFFEELWYHHGFHMKILHLAGSSGI